METPPVIHLEQLDKRFGTHVALRGVDLTLGGRQIVGVVGPDGAGKTTLIRCLAGLLHLEAKEARVLGYDLRGDVTDLKAHVGYVPQAFSLHRDLSVIENLRFTGRLQQLREPGFSQRAQELLERTAMTPFAHRATGALSGGMKMKLSIANALLAEPALLLLDEPTAGVDVLARAEIWSLLERERQRALVIMSTSYLDEAERCDRLVYVDGGRIVATGTPAELRAAVPLQLYLAWGDDPRAIAAAARGLAYVSGARATGRVARIEVSASASPGEPRVLHDLKCMRAGLVSFAAPTSMDMESTLLALARRGGSG
jgi:ABC-2 type transport system ATP-binding protein